MAKLEEMPGQLWCLVTEDSEITQAAVATAATLT